MESHRGKASLYTLTYQNNDKTGLSMGLVHRPTTAPVGSPAARVASSRSSDLGLGIPVSVTGERSRARGCCTVRRTELLRKLRVTSSAYTGFDYICIPKVIYMHFINYTDFQKLIYYLKIRFNILFSLWCHCLGFPL